MLKNIIEAIIFASGSGIKKELILEFMPDVKEEDFDVAVEELKKEYSGERGILLIYSAGKYIFQTNPSYGEILADVLTKEKERDLSKTLLEVMAIIAYKQPITRIEIEDIRGVNSEYAIAMLLKLNLIDCVGRKETIGRPILYGSTEEFLLRFKLESINDLPDYDTLYEQIKSSYSSLLFPEKTIEEPNDQYLLGQKEAVAVFDTEDKKEEDLEINEEINENEYPDFLKDEEFEIIK